MKSLKTISTLATTAFLGLLWSTTINAASPEKVYGVVEMDFKENGNFFKKTIKEMGTEEAAAIGTAVCAAFEVDCSAIAQAAAEAAKQIAIKMGLHRGEEYTAGIFPPPGFDLCRAKVNMFSISGRSTMNTSILNADDNGNPNGPFYLAFYVVVPKTNKGENASGRFALEFVPIGERDKHSCWPVGSQPSLCSGQNCSFYSGGGGSWWDGTTKIDWKKINQETISE
jgi:hypothetical protein